MALTKIVGRMVTDSTLTTSKISNGTLLPIDLSGSLAAAGAVGDGVTNDAAAWQTVISSGAKVIDGYGLTYRVDSGLTLVANQEIRNATFDFSNAASGTKLFTGTSTQGSTSALTANCAYGTQTVTIASTSGYAAQDYVWISSSAVWASGVTVGEIARVRSVDSGTQLTLMQVVSNDYNTADSATVRKLNNEVRNVTFTNVKATGRGETYQQYGADFQYCAEIFFKNCTFDSFDDRCVNLTRCVHARFTDCTMTRSRRAGLAYGVCIVTGCRDISVIGCRFAWMRHGVTLGGSAGVDRDVRVVGCHFDYMLDAGVDTHSAAQYTVVSGNTINGDYDFESATGVADGLMVQGTHAIISNNIIHHAGRMGIYYQPLVTGCQGDQTCIITGNLIDRVAQIGIYCQSTTTKKVSGLVISGNHVRDQVSTSHFGIAVYAQTGSIHHVSVTGNTVTDIDGSGIFLRAATTTEASAGSLYYATVSGNTVQLTAAADAASKRAIETISVRRLSVVGNVTESGWGSYYGTTDDEVVIAGNSWWGATTSDDPNTAASSKVIVGNSRNEDSAVSVTIASGAVTATAGWLKLDTEGSAASDDLDTLTASLGVGQIVILQTTAAARDVVLKHNTGNILLNGAADFTLDRIEDTCVLLWTGAKWVQIGGANNLT